MPLITYFLARVVNLYDILCFLRMFSNLFMSVKEVNLTVVPDLLYWHIA